MIHIIPRVKHLETKQGFFNCTGVHFSRDYDPRLVRALEKLPYDENGANVSISVNGDTGDGYELWIEANSIEICAESNAGAFYAIQTIRQIFKSERIPCLYIKDKPDFEYRGFYHDITRGKIANIETLKWLVEQMAYYKLNSLQLYVEHTFEFKECEELNSKTGYITKEEIRELDAFCKEHFIDFIPSLSCFGHMFEILQQDKQKHLCVLKDYTADNNFWKDRMRHHTIDPREPGSIELIKSLIDQYAENFSSDAFNIGCDETFDLEACDNENKLYIEFVMKIINHVMRKGKKVMMWADILLKHPETIKKLPGENIYYLNWNYLPDAKEDAAIELKKLGKPQILCPATWSFSRLCERVDWEEPNISRMAEYGKRNGAVGILNTNWGDRGNPASLELAMYGMVLGAEKSWSAYNVVDNEFYQSVNWLLYGAENGMEALIRLSEIHKLIDWNEFGDSYFAYRFDGEKKKVITEENVIKIQTETTALIKELSKQHWENDEYRQEIIIAAECLCVMAELNAKIMGYKVNRITDTEEWLAKYREKWMKKNKKSELHNIENMFMYMEKN